MPLWGSRNWPLVWTARTEIWGGRLICGIWYSIRSLNNSDAAAMNRRNSDFDDRRWKLPGKIPAIRFENENLWNLISNNWMLRFYLILNSSSSSDSHPFLFFPLSNHRIKHQSNTPSTNMNKKKKQVSTFHSTKVVLWTGKVNLGTKLMRVEMQITHNFQLNINELIWKRIEIIESEKSKRDKRYPHSWHKFDRYISFFYIKIIWIAS